MPFLCAARAPYLRDWQPGRNYQASQTAYNMARVWPEHLVFHGDLPSFMDLPISRNQVTQDRLVRGNGVSIHAPFRTKASGNKVVEMLRGGPAFVPSIGLDIPQALFYCALFRALPPSCSSRKQQRDTSNEGRSAPVGCPARIANCPFSRRAKQRSVFTSKAISSSPTDGSSQRRSWMSPAMMDVVNQALVVGNAPGRSVSSSSPPSTLASRRSTAARHTNARAESAAESTRQRRKALSESSRPISQSCNACRARCSAAQTGTSRRSLASRTATGGSRD